MTVIWSPVVGYEGLYQVCNTGFVFSYPRRGSRGGLLRPGLSEGYPAVSLNKNGTSKSRKIHQLVLEAFEGACPPGHECRHLDGNRRNNEWPQNLEWGTPSENNRDRTLHGTNPSSRLSDDQIRDALTAWENGGTVAVLAVDLGVTKTALRKRMQQLDASRYERLAVGNGKLSDETVLVFYQRWRAGESKRSLAAEAEVDRHALTFRFDKISREKAV
jgi:hypothetical protein